MQRTFALYFTNIVLIFFSLKVYLSFQEKKTFFTRSVSSNREVLRRAAFFNLYTVCSEADGTSYGLTKVYTPLVPGAQWHWCRRSELQRNPLFSKHSYCEEELIIQSHGPRQPHFTAPQRTGHQHDAALHALVPFPAPDKIC